MEYIPFAQNRQHLFHKYQSLLVWFLNLKEGREFIGLKKWGSKWEGRIDKVTPSGFTANLEYDKFWHPKKGYFEFYPRNPVETKLLPFIEKFDLYAPFVKDAEEGKRAFLALVGLLPKKKEIYLPFVLFTDFGPFNPATGTASPVDGRIYSATFNSTLATLRSGVGLNASDSNGDATIVYLGSDQGGQTSGNFKYLVRSFFLYDSSSIGSTNNVDTGTHSVYGTGSATTGEGAFSIDLVSSNPASTSTLAATQADFTSVGGTRLATGISSASWTTAYNDWTLNASGLANISKTGISKFATILNWDFDNSFGGAWVDMANSSAGGNYADNGSNKPKLAGTYSPINDGTTVAYKSLLGVGQA